MKCRLDSLLGSWFYKLGLTVGRTPGYFIIIPILLTLLCITGYQRIHYMIDPEYLFSPENGEGKYERAVVESFFKMNYSARFNPTRITRPGMLMVRLVYWLACLAKSCKEIRLNRNYYNVGRRELIYVIGVFLYC